MNDWIEVGIFGEQTKDIKDNVLLYLAKHRLTGGQNTIELLITGKPAKAGIDPYFKLIDRNPDDNLTTIRPNRKK